jgi:hypothetical protein
VAIVRPSAAAGENVVAGTALPTAPVKMVPSLTDVTQKRPEAASTATLSGNTCGRAAGG